MAEDQAQNGDAWNEESSELFKRLGWEFVGSSNIDISDSKGHKRGLDRIYRFPEGFNNKRDTGVFVEAKRYAPSSFSQLELNNWVTGLQSKVDALRTSSSLATKFPVVKDLVLVTGLIVIWFHNDSGKQTDHRENFARYIRNVPVTGASAQRPFNTGIFVIENSTILRMISMVDAIAAWKVERPNSEVKFYYPSSALHGNSVRILEALNIPYLFSDFIFAKGLQSGADSRAETDMIFNFGKLDIPSFEALKDAALRHNMLSDRNDLVLYNYQRDPGEFRKIRDDVKVLFGSGTSKSFEMKAMNESQSLPPWMVEGNTQ